MIDIALILICIGLLAKALGKMARDPRVDRPAMRRVLAFSAIFIPGVALLSVTASYLLATVTQNTGLIQAVLLVPVVVALLALESLRWMPRIEGRFWRPSRLFRAFEVGLPVLVVALVVWAMADPISSL